MDNIGLLELYKGTLIHYRFSSYFGYNYDHSLCNVHILRDLIYIENTFMLVRLNKLENYSLMLK
ncbi:MAG: hypothetical protein HRT67_00185 [Flavobacteriaceae bacterium]|nr:hypothetical protein [Flavobacteriaceae bacterium]